MMIKIDKGVPIPDKGRRGRSKKYPWDSMEVGDSFLVIGDDIGKRGLSSQGSMAGLRLGRKFVTAKDQNGVRVWRVE